MFAESLKCHRRSVLRPGKLGYHQLRFHRMGANS